jgi:uncharacterized iron-regulated protein
MDCSVEMRALKQRINENQLRVELKNLQEALKLYIELQIKKELNKMEEVILSASQVVQVYTIIEAYASQHNLTIQQAVDALAAERMCVDIATGQWRPCPPRKAIDG